MESFHAVFEHMPAYHVAICKTHGQAVLQPEVRNHLQSHAECTRATRQKIVLAAAAYRPWAATEDQVVYPGAGARPIAHLPVYENGFQCTLCGHIYRHVKGIQAHCRDKHGWESSRRRGRPYQGRPPERQTMWIEGIWCQKLQPTGRLSRLFKVDPPPGHIPPSAEDREMQTAIHVSLSQAMDQFNAAEQTQQAHIQADEDRFQYSAWLDRAGWAKHLKGLNRPWLSTLTRPPAAREKALERVCWAAQMVIWKAQQASRPNVVGMGAMNYINRREMGNHTNEKPFNARQTGKTMVKYSGWWLEILRYIWRTHALPTVRHGEGQADADGRRPPYQLTGQQEVLLQKIRAIVRWKEEDEWSDAFNEANDSDDSDDALAPEQEERVQDLVLNFMLALLDHALGDNEYASALISAMAVLGIDADCGWMSPLIYTPKQAAVVNISRMLVLYRSTQLRKDRIAELRGQGWSQPDAEDVAPSHFQFTKEMANRFMTLTGYGGEPTPVDFIQRLKAYGMKIRFTTNAEGVVDWVDDALLYGNIQFSMPQLRSMVHGMIASTRHQLMGELMLLQVDGEGAVVEKTTALPAIHWERLVDNAAERKVGWSFMTDARNQAAIDVDDPPKWLGRRVAQERRLRDAFIDTTASRAVMAAGGAAVWKQDRVETYRRAMKSFREGLLVLKHMTGGMPARGSELVTIQYKNSANGDSRGVTIEDGLVVCTTAYHKNVGSTGKSKVIQRYLPREVGELMVYYLWFALPFWIQMEGAVGKPVKVSEYIWEPEPERAWTMPQRKRRRTEDGEQEDEEPSAEAGAEQEVGQRMETWNSNRISSAIRKRSLQYMGVGLNIMAWRHGSKAIYRRHIDNASAVRAFIRADEEGSDAEDEAFDMQAGHGSSVANMIYGRPITEATFSTEGKRAALRRVSMEWHAFLQVPSAMETRPGRGTRAAAVRKEGQQEAYRRWKMMRQVDVEEALKRMVGAQARFRSVQRAAVDAIMQQKSPVVAIMGTGAGKSVLFMLPASVSSGVTVVVVPLTSLREDMKARCDRIGIACVEWDSRRPHEWAQVVLVTPESAVGEGFGHFINRQRGMGRLDRIVVDECHVVLDSLHGWRARVLALRRLVTVGTQMVYLTATLRPSEEAPFIESMGLPAKEQCQWFRGVTARSNIQYRIQAYDAKDEEAAVGTLVRELKDKYPPPGQIIVYCDTVEKTVRLATVLDCVCYHRTVGSSAMKRRLVEQLTSGQHQVFTATNAWGLGIDAPSVRAVVHMGIVRQIRHYAQESGRAGRDGARSEAIIMRGFRGTRGGPVALPFGKEVEAEMRELIEGRGCMRKVLDRAMDGRDDGLDCGDGVEPCQRCQAVDEEGTVEEGTVEEGTVEEGTVEEDRVEEGRATPEDMDEAEFAQEISTRRAYSMQEARHQAHEAMQVEVLEGLMEQWKVGCQRCRAWGLGGEGHGIWSCKREMADEIRQGVMAFEARKKWAAYSCCWDCGLPQSVCESFAMDITNGGHRKQQGVECQYGGVLVETVVSLWARHTQAFGDMLEDVMRGDGWVERTAEEREVGPGMEAMYRWFCEKKRWGGSEGNKMSWFVVEFVQRLGVD